MSKWAEIVESMPEPMRDAFLKWWKEHPPLSYSPDWQTLIVEAGPPAPRTKSDDAMDALMTMTPHERGLVLCWFCDACYEYVGPGDTHRCTRLGSVIYPPAGKVT